jgi:hypothetical protein
MSIPRVFHENADREMRGAMAAWHGLETQCGMLKSCASSDHDVVIARGFA